MTDIPIVELKPCPFCAGVPELLNMDELRTHCAPDCPCADLECKRGAWNTRAPDPTLKECVEVLEGAVDELENCAGQFRALGMTGCAQYAEAQKVKIDATLAAMTKGEE